jgi:hypothetical protein
MIKLNSWRALLLLEVAAVVTLFVSPASAGPIDKYYTTSSSFFDDTLGGYLSIRSFGGEIGPSASHGTTLTIANVTQFAPDPNFYPGGIFPDIVYKDTPFTIAINPSNLIPPGLPDYHYTITGPQSDGAVIHGVFSGTISATGKSDLVATFQSITPNDIPSLLTGLSNVTYTVDPTLSNPFPVDLVNLHDPVHLNLNGYTDLSITLVPEPHPLMVFAPLVLGLVGYRGWLRRMRSRSAA